MLRVETGNETAPRDRPGGPRGARYDPDGRCRVGTS
jgi:hypothetical protein